MLPNPSHLEAVDPVVIGFARSKADVIYESDYDKILPILIHGDSSLAGQGIIYEVLQMSGLKGYYAGGTLHFVINNQIGFTTDFDDARTSDYCTSGASMIQAPVFHVNGDDVEAVVKASQIAVRKANPRRATGGKTQTGRRLDAIHGDGKGEQGIRSGRPARPEDPDRDGQVQRGAGEGRRDARRRRAARRARRASACGSPAASGPSSTARSPRPRSSSRASGSGR